MCCVGLLEGRIKFLHFLSVSAFMPLIVNFFEYRGDLKYAADALIADAMRFLTASSSPCSAYANDSSFPYGRSGSRVMHGTEGCPISLRY